ncbi:MAG: hypothetical protein Q9169_000678 [Polycauliona sp. 2 TL-2023]
MNDLRLRFESSVGHIGQVVNWMEYLTCGWRKKREKRILRVVLHPSRDRTERKRAFEQDLPVKQVRKAEPRKCFQPLPADKEGRHEGSLNRARGYYCSAAPTRSGVLRSEYSSYIIQMSSDMNNDAMDTDPFIIDDLSRPFKRRKPNRKPVDSYRSSPAETSNNTPKLPSTDDAPAEPPPLESLDDHDQSLLSVADVLRRRRATQRKRAGIGFTNAAVIPKDSDVEAMAGDGILDNDTSLDKILTVVDRFAPQTGQVADVDKHMYAKPKFIIPRSEEYMLTL